MDRPATRVCRDCGIEKPLDRDHFTPSQGYAWGFRPRCKACRRARFTARYRSDPVFAAQVNATQSRTWRNQTPEQRAARYAYMAAYRRRSQTVDTTPASV